MSFNVEVLEDDDFPVESFEVLEEETNQVVETPEATEEVKSTEPVEEDEVTKLKAELAEAKAALQAKQAPAEPAFPEDDSDLDFLLEPAKATAEAVRRYGVRQAQVKAANEEAAGKALASVRDAHSDFEEVVKSADYAEFVKKDPVAQRIMKSSVEQYDGEGLAAVISMYKATRPASVNAVQADAEEEVSIKQNAVTGPAASKKIWTRFEIQSMTRDQREKLDDVLMQAYAENRVK